jgi:hypothetical protein
VKRRNRGRGEMDEGEGRRKGRIKFKPWINLLLDYCVSVGKNTAVLNYLCVVLIFCERIL